MWWRYLETDRIGSQELDGVCHDHLEEQPSPSLPASLPAFHVIKGGIHEVIQGSIRAVRLSDKGCLASALGFKARAARIRHPDLNGAQTGSPQGVSAFLNTL